MKKVFIMLIFLITCLIVSPTPALKYEASTGSPGGCPDTPELFIDGENITGQVSMVPEKGHCYLPLRPVAEKLGFQVHWDPRNGTIILGRDGATVHLSVASAREIVNGVERKLDAAPFARNSVTYIPVQLIPEIPGCRAIRVEQANAWAVFSRPLVQTTAAVENEMAQILMGYLNTDIYRLPKDVHQIRAIYAAYIHPGHLDAFAANLLQDVTIPTSWGVTEYVTSEVVAQTADAAVVLCRVKYTDCDHEGYLHQLWGFKKYNDKWMLVW